MSWCSRISRRVRRCDLDFVEVKKTGKKSPKLPLFHLASLKRYGRCVCRRARRIALSAARRSLPYVARSSSSPDLTPSKSRVPDLCRAQIQAMTHGDVAANRVIYAATAARIAPLCSSLPSAVPCRLTHRYCSFVEVTLFASSEFYLAPNPRRSVLYGNRISVLTPAMFSSYPSLTYMYFAGCCASVLIWLVTFSKIASRTSTPRHLLGTPPSKFCKPASVRMSTSAYDLADLWRPTS